MKGTPEQLAALGRAARELLRFAWSEMPRSDLIVTNALIAVGKTIATDPTASTNLLRQAIEPAHLREHGYKELRWIAHNMVEIAGADPAFTIDFYSKAYGYAESSDAKTNMGNSALLPLSSNRRQDYEGTWYMLSECLPKILKSDIETGVRALARSLDGYVQRERNHGPYNGEPERDKFSWVQAEADFKADWSHSWYRGGFQPHQDAPILLKKFDDHLRELANEAQPDAEIAKILAVLASEPDVCAAIWGSLLVAGTEKPALFARYLLPLAVARPVMLSSDTRHQLGNFLTAAYEQFTPAERSSIEAGILSLSQERPAARYKAILAGCIPKAFVATEEMRSYIAALEQAGETQANAQPVRFTSYSRAFDTDAYLQEEGVSLEEPENKALRERIGDIETLVSSGAATDLSLKSVKRQLVLLERIRSEMDARFSGTVPDTLYDHAVGKLAEAAARLAKAVPKVTKSRAIRPALKQVLLFCASSKNPRYNKEEEKQFHQNLAWGGPSARTSAAQGLMDMVRGDTKPDLEAMAAIRKLARDPVPHVRLQIIQNLAMLRILEREWIWTEAEYVLRKEKTRGVVGGALGAVSNFAWIDIAGAIRLAKIVLDRYRGKKGAGMGDCRAMAESMIFDISIYRDNAEADAFAATLISNLLGEPERIKNLIARHSSNLLRGSLDNPGAVEQAHRRKTIVFYRTVARAAFAEIAKCAQGRDWRQFGAWPADDKETVQTLYSILDEICIRLYFSATSGPNNGEDVEEFALRKARVYEEAQDIFAALAGAVAAPIAHHLIQALEIYIPLDPAGVFALIAESVRSSEVGGYSLENMGADVVVRIVEAYLADYRSVFADQNRLNDLMDCLDVFVRAGWPSAQSLTFRLGEIWR